MATASFAPDIIGRYGSGETLEEIGSVYGVTRERIRQILKIHGLAGKDGGAVARAHERKKQKTLSKSIQCQSRTGMTLDEFRSVNPRGDFTSVPYVRYRYQERNAQNRGIGFHLTFRDWWRLWQESGHWDQMGRGGDKYGMSRKDLEAPFTFDNCVIRKNGESASINVRTRSHVTRRRRLESRQ